MAPLKKIYLEELARIQDRIHDLFEQALLASEYDERDGGSPGTWTPAVDVLETEDSYLLFAELPGVRREDIQLQVKDRRLELSGRRPTLGENRNFLRMECSYGPFRRAFELAVPVESESITAQFEQGVLKVHVPKRGAGSTRAAAREEEP
ncbi:MAG TPA: Hsp20/alpha crystallin family protein [Thermoanaerobaculia bacterium]|nr:Hsp20/alpha crystallin family protein [Thermoanaerobaculia bacterium]